MQEGTGGIEEEAGATGRPRLTPEGFQAWARALKNFLSVAVLVTFVILSLIVQIRDASMDTASVLERHELKERLDNADRDRTQLRQRVESLERELDERRR